MAKNATLASLGVDIEMQTAKFDKATKEIKGQLGGIQQSFNKVAGTIKGFGAALGVGVAVAALGSAFRTMKGIYESFEEVITSAIERIDALNHQAIKLGTTTENLQALGFAAGLAGSNGEKLQDALKDVGIKLGDIKGDTDAAAIAYAKLGLNWREMKALDPAEIFKRIADGMKNLSSTSEQLSVLNVLAGEGGVSLHELAAGGREAIEASEKLARQLGITISELDANKISAAADAMSTLGQVFEGIGNQIAAEVSPYIVGAINDILGLGKSVGSVNMAVKLGVVTVREWGLAFVDFLTGKVIPGFNIFAELVEKVTGKDIRISGAIRDQLEEWAVKGNEAAEAFEKQQEAMRKSAAEAKNIASPLEEATKNANEFADALWQQLQTFDMNAAEVEIWKNNLDELNPEMAETLRYLQKQIELKEEAKKAEEEAAAAAKKAAEEAKKAQEAQLQGFMDRIKQAKEAAKSGAELFAEEMTELNTALAVGLIDAFEHAVLEAEARKKHLDDEIKEMNDPGSPLIEGKRYGSAAANTAILEHRFGDGNTAPLKELNKTAKDQLKKTEDGNKWLESIANHFNDFQVANIS